MTALYSSIVHEKIDNIHTLTLDFTTFSDGTVTVNEAGAASVALPVLGGQLQRIIVTPTDLTDLFDITLLDSNDVDLLEGDGADVSDTGATEFALDSRPFVSGEHVRLQVTNGGDTKTGTLKIYYMMG